MPRFISKMVYERLKEVDGRLYRYLVTGIRYGDVVKQKVVKYLGAVNAIYRVKKRRSNASIFVKKLNEFEKDELLYAVHSSNAFIRERARALLLSDKRKSSVEIAREIGCEERKIRFAIKDFNERGLICLKRKKREYKKKFSNEDIQAILIHFSKKPKEFGYPISAWTLPRFHKHLLKNKVVESISLEKVRQILLQAGAKLERSKRWQYSPDKNFLQKNRR